MTNEHPHRRFNPLRSEWVLVSPHRTERPWQGQIEPVATDQPPVFDRTCHLCPGNERRSGIRNPPYTSTFAFENDYPALVPSAPTFAGSDPDLLRVRSERGACRVLCFSPRHDLSLARMDRSAIGSVVDAWIEEYEKMAALPWVSYAVAFENRGPMMGASNPHPHGQIWATESVPDEPAREQAAFDGYRSRRGSCLLCDYAALEARLAERVVCANDGFVAVVPFWAVWPFETLIVSRRHAETLQALDAAERTALADILKRLTTRYDNLFEIPFPYTMGIHAAPARGAAHGSWHLHAHFYPPLLRSATIRKFLVGFELFGSPQRDVTPEQAAARLQGASEVHYTVRSRDEVAP